MPKVKQQAECWETNEHEKRAESKDTRHTTARAALSRWLDAPPAQLIQSQQARVRSRVNNKSRPMKMTSLEEVEEGEDTPLAHAQPGKTMQSSAELLKKIQVRSRFLQELAQEQASWRWNLSLGLKGLHDIARMRLREEARKTWLNDAIMVGWLVVTSIEELQGLERSVREFCLSLDEVARRCVSCLLKAQTLSRSPGSRLSLAHRVLDLIPDAQPDGFDFPDIFEMFNLLESWKAKKIGFVEDSGIENVSETASYVDRLLNELETVQYDDEWDIVTNILERSQYQAMKENNWSAEEQARCKDTTDGQMEEDIQGLDSAIENLKECENHLESLLDRALEIQVCIHSVSLHCKENAIMKYTYSLCST